MLPSARTGAPVLNLGGSSLADVERLCRAARLRLQAGGATAVASSMAGVTDELLRMGETAARAEPSEVCDLSQHLLEIHRAARRALGPRLGKAATLALAGRDTDRAVTRQHRVLFERPTRRRRVAS